MRLVEIADIGDDLLLPWLDLYETSFAPAERVLVSSHLGVLKRKRAGEASNEFLLAAVGSGGELLATMRLELMPGVSTAFLWYIAVKPEKRGRGLGGACYEAIRERVEQAGMASMIFEVEIPEHAESEDGAELARRRIEFYRRHGARLLLGVRYLQSVGPHQPTIPMHLMVHPFGTMTPEQAWELARQVVGDAVTLTGVPALG